MRPDYRYATGGFSLIELLIVVTIIGILAAIAIPVYSDFVARAQFTEAESLAAPLRLYVDEMYQDLHTFQGINNGVGPIPEASGVSGRYVAKTNVLNGYITVHFSSDSTLAGKRMRLRPLRRSDGVRWVCKTDVSPARSSRQCKTIHRIPEK